MGIESSVCFRGRWICSGREYGGRCLDATTVAATFHDYFILDDQARPESGVDADIFMDQRDRLLPNRLQASAVQLVGQDHIVNGFQQTRSERGVNAKSCVHNLLGDGVFGHRGILYFHAKPPRTPARS